MSKYDIPYDEETERDLDRIRSGEVSTHSPDLDRLIRSTSRSYIFNKQQVGNINNTSSDSYLSDIYSKSDEIRDYLNNVNYQPTDNTVWGNLTTGFKSGLAGTVEGLGGFASLIGLDVIGKPITESMQDYQNSFRPTGYQYNQDNPLAFLGDSNYYSSGQFARDAGQGIGSLASFLVPQLGGAKLVSAIGNVSKGTGLLANAARNPYAQKIIGSLAPTATESATEAGFVYNETGDSEAAWKNFGANTALLGITNASEVALAFAKGGEKVFGSFAKKYPKTSAVSEFAGKVAGTGMLEGYQEIMQERFQNNSINGKNPLLDSSLNPIPQTVEEGVSGFIGAMMGGSMGGIGHIASGFGNKTNPNADLNNPGTELTSNNTPEVNPSGNPGRENVNTIPLQLPYTTRLQLTHNDKLQLPYNTPLPLDYNSIDGDSFIMQNPNINQTALDIQTQYENDFKSGRISPQEYQTLLNTGTELYQPVAQHGNITVEQPVPQDQKQAPDTQAASINDFLVNAAIDINNKVVRPAISETLINKAKEGHPTALRGLPKAISEAMDSIENTKKTNNGFFGKQLDTINQTATSIDLALRDKFKRTNPASYTPEKIAELLANSPNFKNASTDIIRKASLETLSRSKMLKKLNPNQQNLFGDSSVQFSESVNKGNKPVKENPIRQLTSFYRGDTIAGHSLKTRTVLFNKDGTYAKGISDDMKFVNSLASMFDVQREVIFFKSDSLSKKGVNGFYRSKDGKMYINEESPKSAHWVFGHEFTHWMASSGAKEFKVIKKFFEQNISPEEHKQLIEAYRSYVGVDPKTLKSSMGKTYTDEVVIEDILADLIADRFTTGEFIHDIADIDRRWKGFFDRVIALIRNFFNRIKGKTESEFDKKGLAKIENDINSLIDNVLKKKALDNIAYRPTVIESDPIISKNNNPDKALNGNDISETNQALEQNRLKYKELLDDKRSTKEKYFYQEPETSSKTGNIKNYGNIEKTVNNNQQYIENTVKPSIENHIRDFYEKHSDSFYNENERATGEDFYSPAIWDFKDGQGRVFTDNEQMNSIDYEAMRIITESKNPKEIAHAKQALFKKYIKFAQKIAIGNIKDKEMHTYLRSDAAAVLLKVLGAKTKRENLYGKGGLTQEAKQRYVTLETANSIDLKTDVEPFNFKTHFPKIKRAYEDYIKFKPNATNAEVEKYLFSPVSEFASESEAGIKINSFKNWLVKMIKGEISETKKEFDKKNIDKELSYSDVDLFNKAVDRLKQEKHFIDNGIEPNYLDAARYLASQGLSDWVKKYHKDNDVYPSNEELNNQKEIIFNSHLRKGYAMLSYGSNTSLESLFNIVDDQDLYNLDNINENSYSDFNTPISDIDSSNNVAKIIIRTLEHDLSPTERDIVLAKSPFFRDMDIDDNSYSDLLKRHQELSPFSTRFEKLENQKEELEKILKKENDLPNLHEELKIQRSLWRKHPNEHGYKDIPKKIKTLETKIAELESAQKELSKTNESIAKLREALAKKLGISMLELEGYEASIKTHFEEATKKHFRKESQLKIKDTDTNIDDIYFSETANIMPKNSIKEFANMIKDKLLANREVPKKDVLGLVQKYLRSPSKLAEIFPQFGKIYKLAKGSFELEQRLKTRFFENLNPVFDSLTTDEQRKALDNAVLAANLMGRDLSDKEIRTFKNADEKVVKAYRDLRKHLDMIHRNLNKINQRMGRNPINYIKGYFPHIWDDWQVAYKDTEGNTIKQSYPTHTEALAAWKEARKLDSKAAITFSVPSFHNTPNYTHIERTELSNHEEQEMLQEFTLDANDLDALSPDIENLLKRRDYLPTQHRFFAHLMQRKGMEGYSTDVRRVISKYTNRSARYMALEPFKTKAVDSFTENFGSFEKDYSDNPLAAYTKQYILDINGNPSNIEEYLNRLIGQIPYLADFLRKHTSYGNRFALGLANGISEVTTITTLGFFNVATALVQLSQVMNVYGLVGKNNLFNAFNRLTDLSKEDKWVLKASGILYDANLANSSGYAKGAGQLSYNNKIQALAQKTMWLFTQGDLLARKVAVLSGYHKAIKEGKSRKEALEYAKEVNRKTNYDYSIVDASGAFRNFSVVGQVALQFKKFSVKQGEFVYDLFFDKNSTKEQKIRFFGAMFAMAGLMGLPFGDMLDEILKAITGKDIGSNARNYLIQNSGNGLQKALTHQAIYGLGSHAGVDLSKRVGIYDSIPNNYAPGITRPIIAMQSMFKHGMTSPEFLGNVVPTLGNLATGYQGYPKGMENLHYTNSERLLRAFGFIPLRESIERDKRIYAIKNQQEKKNNSKKEKAS